MVSSTQGAITLMIGNLMTGWAIAMLYFIPYNLIIYTVLGFFGIYEFKCTDRLVVAILCRRLAKYSTLKSDNEIARGTCYGKWFIAYPNNDDYNNKSYIIITTKSQYELLTRFDENSDIVASARTEDEVSKKVGPREPFEIYDYTNSYCSKRKSIYMRSIQK